MMSSSRRWLWLSAIIAAEALLFVWKYNHFFNGDSLFFFSHRVESWADIWRVFKGPDNLWQYRPLTFVIFSFVLEPLFGINRLGYNLFPLLVHAGNTLIVFRILCTLGLADRAALFGTFIFGAHCAAFYVTYDVAFLPDLSFSLFYLTSVLFFIKSLRAEKRVSLALSLLFFILALFCKEAAVTLPAVVVAISFLWGKEGFSPAQVSIGRAAGVCFRRSFPFIVLGAVYLGFHWIVKAGQMSGLGIDHPHHIELGLQSLRFKYKYLKWAFNLPDSLMFNFEGLANYLIALSTAVFAIPFVLSTIRRLLRLNRLAWCGCVWFVVALSPVLFLSNLTMHHNLYVPLVGLALVFGNWLHDAVEWFEHFGKARARAVVVAFVAFYIAAVFFHNLHAIKDSWIAEASSIAETSLHDIQRQRPTLPDGATLYFVDRSSLGSLRWFYDYGTLVRLFYPSGTQQIIFIDRGYKLPDINEMPSGAIVFEYDGTHLKEIPARSKEILHESGQ
jgi:hypothetical protein